MVLLKEQIEYAKKKHGFPNTRKMKKFKKNKTGFYRVSKVICTSCVNGYTYVYRWFDIERDKKATMSSTDFTKLKEKVQARNLKWEINNYSEARKTARDIGLPLRDLI